MNGELIRPINIKFSVFPFQFYHRDLDIASMKAVALLLDGLPLQPPESSERNGSDEKAKIFYKCVLAIYHIPTYIL